MSSDNWHSERSMPMDLGERQGLAQKAQLKNTGQGSSRTNQTGIELFYLPAEALDRQYWGWGRVRNRRLTYLEIKGIVFVLETSRGATCQSGCPDSTKEVRPRNKRCKHHEDMPGNEAKGKGALNSKWVLLWNIQGQNTKKIHTRNQKGKATIVQTERMAPKSRESSLRCRVLCCVAHLNLVCLRSILKHMTMTE